MLSRPNGRFHHLRPGQSRGSRAWTPRSRQSCLFCMHALVGLEVQSKVSGQAGKIRLPAPQRGSLIMVWLEVRVLPAPPRTPIRTGVSKSLTNTPHFAGVYARSNAGRASLPPGKFATARILARSLWALQTRSWRQTGVAREDRRNQIDKPSIAYWRDHSAGVSRRRVTPMPRGNRPATAACTSSGARNASEIVILTCRMLHFSRAAI